jgi:sugar porter (SP) family MFS transporter
MRFINTPPSDGKSKLPAILMTTFAAFGGILYGYDTGTISGIIAMPAWLQIFGQPGLGTQTADNPQAYGISAQTTSLVVSILSAGTFFGALGAYPVGDYLGRKLGLILACLIFSVGVAFQVAASALPLFVVGRVIAGLGVGLVSCLVPMYQSECSPKWIRGAVVACYQWAITIGLLLASCANEGEKDKPDASGYRWVISIQFFWAAILAGGMCFLPESPRYLIKRGKNEKARANLGRVLRASIDSPEVKAEYEEIEANLRHEQSLGQTSYIDCFRNGPGHNRLRVLTGIFLQAWQQLTGINFIFYYGTTFFTQAGISNPFVVSIVTNVVNVVSTLPGMWAVDNLGRRKLLLIGAAGMCICEYIVAIVGVSTSSTNVSAQQSLIAFVCIYIFFFAASWGPCAWVITGELYPLGIRAKAMSMSTASNWLWNWGIAYATPYLVKTGPGNAGLGVKVFFIWGSTCAGCLIFTYFFIPETKGLSLEQVDELYNDNVKPWQSTRWVPESHHWAEERRKSSVAQIERTGSGQRVHSMDTANEKNGVDNIDLDKQV